MIICTFDDRTSDIIGLKLLIASLHVYAPGVPVHLACPAADAAFETWLTAYPQVQFDKAEHLRGKGWDVKPILLRQLLDQGHDEVLWMDSDIVVTGRFLEDLPADRAFVVTEEPAVTPYGLRQRVLGWGLTAGRSLPGVNSCVVRANHAHIPLIDRWLELMRHPDYLQARSLPFEQRMPHLLTDQDVLLALLASTEFSQLPVHFLRAGREIMQSHGAAGYTPMQRLRSLFAGVPPLVHSQGHKPWRTPGERSIFKPAEFLLQLHLETAPYAHYARRYRSAIQPFPACLELRTAAGRLSNVLSFGHPSLRGMTLAIGSAIALWWRKVTGLAARGIRKAMRIMLKGRGRAEIT